MGMKKARSQRTQTEAPRSALELERDRATRRLARVCGRRSSENSRFSVCLALLAKICAMGTRSEVGCQRKKMFDSKMENYQHVA